MSEFFPDALPPQTTLQNGAFTIQEVLGAGGFGLTYRARDERLHRDAAIKEFFPREAARDRDTMEVLAPSPLEFHNAKEEFLSEARALAQFDHPHIVDVYSVFEENNSAYLVMEWVRGSTLSLLVETRGALTKNEALKIVEQVGSALIEVHRAGLLHLDVKPDNIMLEDASTPGGARAVLLDFGLTRKIEHADPSKNPSKNSYATKRLGAASNSGTPGFAALEQYSQSGNLGAWTDVYALAATLYFLLTATAPPDAAARATGAALPEARELNRDVSTPVAFAIERGLQLEPAQRPQTIEAFLDLFRAENYQKDDDENFASIQILPREGASTPTPQEDYNDPFGARDPNRPGPFRRPRVYGNGNPFSDNPFGSNPLGGNPFSVLPLGFGCTSIGCSIGCFLFIAIFFLVIASLLNSVGSAFRF